LNLGVGICAGSILSPICFYYFKSEYAIYNVK